MRHYQPKEPMRARHQTGYVEATAAKTWKAHWYEYIRDTNGVERRQHRSRVIGQMSEMRKYHAKEELSKIVASVNARHCSRPDPSVTLAWFIEYRWLPLYANRWSALSTAKTNKQTLQNQILPALGHERLRDLDGQKLSTFLGKLAIKGYGKHLINRCRWMLRSVFEEAVEEDYVTKNPMRRVQMPSNVAPPDETYLSWEQLVSLFEYLPRLEQRDYLLFMVELTTGLRPSETFGLHCPDLIANDLHLKRTVVSHRLQNRTKTGDSDRKIVSLPPSLADELRNYAKTLKDPNGYLFPNCKGGHLQKDNYRTRVIKPIKDALGIKKLDFRVLRRTVGTWGLEHGSIKDVQAQLRHAKPDTLLKFYAKTIPASQREMVASLLESLMAGVEEKKKLAELNPITHSAPERIM